MGNPPRDTEHEHLRSDAHTGTGGVSAHLVTIAELAIAKHHRTGWLPTGLGDATLMRMRLQAIRSAVSLEHPLRNLAMWLKKAEA